MAANPSEVKGLAQKASQANKEHQYTLKVYTERLDAELQTIDKLLAAAEVSEHEDELDVNAGGDVVIPCSVKAVGVIPLSNLLAEGSPFYQDAAKRQKYIESTVIHPMKVPELEALADAVRLENYRIHAYEAQQRGQEPFIGLDDFPPGYFEQNKVGINWERVAKKVSSSGATVQRSAKECEVRWLGERHPQFNHTQWSQTEIARVKELVQDAIEGEVDWVDIASKLGTRRTPIDCMRHAIVRKTHSWTTEADERLLEAVKIYGTDNWILVARMVSEDATAAQCQNRYTRTVDPNIKRGAWTEEEDSRLRRAVAVFGHSWVDVATCIPGRNNEQCRDRYQEYLNPTVSRGKWTEEQDQALLRAYETVGEARWKEISELVGNGRTDNMCRSRYGILMKRQAKQLAAAAASTQPGAGARTQPVRFVSMITASEAAQPAQPAPPRPRVTAPRASTSATPLDESSEPAVPAAEKSRSRPKPRRKIVANTTANAEEGSSIALGAAQAGLSAQDAHIDSDEARIPAHEKGKGKEIAQDGVSQPWPTARARTQRAAKRKSPADGAERPPPKRRRTNAATVADVQPVEGPAAMEQGLPEVAAGQPDEQEQAGPSEPPELSAEPQTSTRTKASARGRKGTRKAPARTKKDRTTETQQKPLLDTTSGDIPATSHQPEDSTDGPRVQASRRGRKTALLTRVEPTRRQPARAAARRSLAATQPADDEPPTGPASQEVHPIQTSAEVRRVEATRSNVLPVEADACDSDLSSLPPTPSEY